MSAEPTRDRLRGLIDLLMEHLDDDADGVAIARRAFLSRFHFDHLIASALGEPPGGFRRRLLLERAGYELGSGSSSVTQVAFDAGYASLEAFERAFRRSFGTTPSAFRRKPSAFRLPSPNGVHFHPPAGLLVPAPIRPGKTMDLIDRLLEHDLWLNRRLLDHASELADADLNRDIRGRPSQPFESDQPTVRGMLDRLVFTREVWIAAVMGRTRPQEDRDTSLAGLRARLDASADEFKAVVRGIRDRGEWDVAFVNALRDPPETFTFGGMLTHVLTFQACRRNELILALGRLGITDLGYGDPMDWEQAMLTGSAVQPQVTKENSLATAVRGREPGRPSHRLDLRGLARIAPDDVPRPIKSPRLHNGED